MRWRTGRMAARGPGARSSTTHGLTRCRGRCTAPRGPTSAASGAPPAAGCGPLPIYLGPTLAMVLGWTVLRKMVRIAHLPQHDHRRLHRQPLRQELGRGGVGDPDYRRRDRSVYRVATQGHRRGLRGGGERGRTRCWTATLVAGEHFLHCAWTGGAYRSFWRAALGQTWRRSSLATPGGHCSPWTCARWCSRPPRPRSRCCTSGARG